MMRDDELNLFFTQTMNQLCTSWIFCRGEKPFMCRNLELDDYLYQKGIVTKCMRDAQVYME